MALLYLPDELFQPISSYLPNSDIKSLRLTCSFFIGRAHLALSRVFISASQRNIEVCRAIADHETFRKGITEIIWDDAHLKTCLEKEDALRYNTSAYDAEQECPSWFVRACNRNIEVVAERRLEDLDHVPGHAARAQQLSAQLPLKRSWEYYQELLQQQEGILASKADVEALRYGLQRFPSLRTITITLCAHGWLFNPLYETPMIRAFPYGFNYAIPRGWPTAADIGRLAPTPPPWDEDGDSGTEAEKNKWRGFRIVTRVLAEKERQHRVSELILDVSQLNTGLNCRIFEKTNSEYNNLVTLLKRPGFRRIDLALNVRAQEYYGWPAFRNGLLHDALSNASGLQHVSLWTNVEHDPDGNATQPGSGGAVEHFIPLRTIFPVDKWPRLCHFGLSEFLVQSADVVALLAALPSTLRSVELSFLEFLDYGGNYRDLLINMRDELGWQERTMASRPRVSIGVVSLDNLVPGRATWVDDEVDNFLYGSGENPFGAEDGTGPNHVYAGTGVVRDAFDPSHERPWMSRAALMRLGYIKKNAWLLAQDDARLAAEGIQIE